MFFFNDFIPLFFFFLLSFSLSVPHRFLSVLFFSSSSSLAFHLSSSASSFFSTISVPFCNSYHLFLSLILHFSSSFFLPSLSLYFSSLPSLNASSLPSLLPRPPDLSLPLPRPPFLHPAATDPSALPSFLPPGCLSPRQHFSLFSLINRKAGRSVAVEDTSGDKM